MIVRILHEGQFEITDSAIEELNQVDDQLVEAVAAEDHARFADLMARLHALVLRSSARVPADYLGESDIILPADDASIDDVRALLSEEGLVPG